MFKSLGFTDKLFGYQKQIQKYHWVTSLFLLTTPKHLGTEKTNCWCLASGVFGQLLPFFDSPLRGVPDTLLKTFFGNRVCGGIHQRITAEIWNIEKKTLQRWMCLPESLVHRYTVLSHHGSLHHSGTDTPADTPHRRSLVHTSHYSRYLTNQAGTSTHLIQGGS